MRECEAIAEEEYEEWRSRGLFELDSARFFGFWQLEQEQQHA